MSIAFETGPVHLYTATRRSSTNTDYFTYPVVSQIDYLGTGEIAPDIIKQPKFDPVFNDIAGSLPYDYLFQGEEAIVPINLTKFNWPILTKINSMVAHDSGTPGRHGPNDIGSLMVGEGYAYPIWCHFPYYSNKTIFNTAGMVAGYHFYAAWVDSLVIQGGTKANKARVNFHCVRVYQPASVNNGWYLFDHVMTNIPNIPPNNNTGVVT